MQGCFGAAAVTNILHTNVLNYATLTVAQPRLFGMGRNKCRLCCCWVYADLFHKGWSEHIYFSS